MTDNETFTGKYVRISSCPFAHRKLKLPIIKRKI